ncbi:MAG: hypothetical protein ACRCXA_11960 [Peptostreptococcaceae bacterium]
MKYYGICPASCGEFVQGFMSNEEYLCSYAIDLYSIATVEERLDLINKGPRKSRKAIELVFKNFDIPIEESKNISLDINSKIPIGKGMASSTADIGATIKATLGLIKKEMSSEEISKLAAKIEATDSIFIEKANIFNPLNGEVIKYLGNVKDARVLILEPDITLDTRQMRSTPNYIETKIKNKSVIKESFYLLEEGIRKNDLNLIGQACTMSSLANENIHHKIGLEDIIEISKNYGAYGVNIAHSGTVVGILLDKSMGYNRIKELIKNKNLDKFYKKLYASDIIDGGIRGGEQWNTLKIL